MSVVESETIDDAFSHETAISLTALDAAREVEGNRHKNLAVMSISGFFGVSCTVTLGVTASTFGSALQLSEIESAMLSAAPLLSAAVLAVPVSLCARVYGGRLLTFGLVMTSALAILILAALLHFVPASDLRSLYPLFVVLGILLGTGIVNVNSGIVHCSWWYPLSQQGRVVGVYLFSISLGPAVFGAFANPALEAMTAGGLFLLWGLLLVAASFLSLIFCENPPYIQLQRRLLRSGARVETLPGTSSKNLIPLTSANVSQAQVVHLCRTLFEQEIFPATNFLQDLKISLTHLTNWMIIILASFSLGSLLAWTVWIPTFFSGVFASSPTTGGLILMGFSFSAAFGCAFSGFLVDAFNAWVVSLLFICGATVCFIVLGVSSSFGLSVAATICAGFLTSSTNVCAYKFVLSLCSEASAGTIGWMESGGDLLAFVVPLVFGAIVTSQGWTRAQGLRAGTAVPACLLGSCSLALLFLFLRQRKK